MKCVLKDIMAILMSHVNHVLALKRTKNLHVAATSRSQAYLVTVRKDIRVHFVIVVQKDSSVIHKTKTDFVKAVTATLKESSPMNAMNLQGSVTAGQVLSEDDATSVNFHVIC